MNKKHIVLIVLCVCAIVVGILFYYLFKKREYIPLLQEYQIEFKMDTDELTEKLGKPIEATSNVCDTGHTMHKYNADVLDHSATIICYFDDDQELIQADITWLFSDFDEARAFGFKAEELLNKAYASEPDYFYKDNSEGNEDVRTVSLGTDNGATGIFYKIDMDGSSLCISCVFNK